MKGRERALYNGVKDKTTGGKKRKGKERNEKQSADRDGRKKREG
jgi:hypothetical protein